MSRPREIVQARNELDLKLNEIVKKYRLTDIDLLSIFNEEMAYSIKHIKETL
jgi:hypothetical protein